VDNSELNQALSAGAEAWGIRLSGEAVKALLLYQTELLRWNQKMNLTAITEPLEVVEKHLLDSIAVAPEVGKDRSLLDVGTGAGMPGLPLKLMEPSLQVTLVDSVQKKIGFVKAAAAALGVSGVKAMHARLEGYPAREGLGAYDVVISRAFAEVPKWLALAQAYLAPGGRAVAMIGKAPPDLDRAGDAHGLRLTSLRRYELPSSKAERHAAVYERP
jgi:16S rRNA (guanine527-N7)-methyltransferase